MERHDPFPPAISGPVANQPKSSSQRRIEASHGDDTTRSTAQAGERFAADARQESIMSGSFSIGKLELRPAIANALGSEEACNAEIKDLGTSEGAIEHQSKPLLQGMHDQRDRPSISTPNPTPRYRSMGSNNQAGRASGVETMERHELDRPDPGPRRGVSGRCGSKTDSDVDAWLNDLGGSHSMVPNPSALTIDTNVLPESQRDIHRVKIRTPLPLSPSPSGLPAVTIRAGKRHASFATTSSAVDSTVYATAGNLVGGPCVHPQTPRVGHSSKMVQMMLTHPGVDVREHTLGKDRGKSILVESKSMPVLSGSDHDEARRDTPARPQITEVTRAPKPKLNTSLSTSTMSSMSISASSSSSTAAADLFTPYRTLVNVATVPVGHFTARPSRLVVRSKTERAVSHAWIEDESFVGGKEGTVDVVDESEVRTRQNTAEGHPVGLGSILSPSMNGLGIGLALQSWAGGWRSGTRSEGDLIGRDGMDPMQLARTLSSQGRKRQRARLKRADELVDWADTGYRVPRGPTQTGTTDAPTNTWRSASEPNTWSSRSSPGNHDEDSDGASDDDDWASFGTQEMWDEADCMNYEDRFGEGKVQKDLQGVLNDIQAPESNKQIVQEAHQSGLAVAIDLQDGQDATTGEHHKGASDSQMIDYGAEDDDWDDDDESEIIVYGRASPERTENIGEPLSGCADGWQQTGVTPADLGSMASVSIHSPPPPPSPQLNDSPIRTWSGALDYDVKAEIKRQDNDQGIAPARPAQPRFPPTLGKICPFRHIVHLAAVSLGIFPENLIDHATFPRLVRACGIDLELARVVVTAELEFQPLNGVHQTPHDVYTFFKQTFRNKEAAVGTLQSLILGLIQLAAGRSIGENAATTLQSLMANIEVICLDFSGECPDHRQKSFEDKDVPNSRLTSSLDDVTSRLGPPDRVARTDAAQGKTSAEELSRRTLDLRHSHALDDSEAPSKLDGVEEFENSHEEQATLSSESSLDPKDIPALPDDSWAPQANELARETTRKLLHKGKGRLISEPDEICTPDKGETNNSVDMEPDIEPDETTAGADIFDVPDLMADSYSNLYFGTSKWSVVARTIGMLSNRAGCPGDHVLDLEEVAICLQEYPGMASVDFKSCLDLAMERDRFVSEHPVSGEWHNYGDEAGVWKASRMHEALGSIAHDLGGWQPFMFGVLALLQLYFGWFVGHDVEGFYDKLGQEDQRYDHVPFEPATPSTIISSPPTRHYPDPYLADIGADERLDELERVARLQIGPSTKRWD